MFNQSNCDKKSQLSGIRTQLLNSREYSFARLFVSKKTKNSVSCFLTISGDLKGLETRRILNKKNC